MVKKYYQVTINCYSMQVGEASPVCMIQRKNAFFKAIKATKSRSAFSWKKNG